ncbi:MAG: beta-phosphoglucomutase family hydrolase [Bifidobacteriaceae bacterium]|jgi:beta-phosphoglucomutase family hydrolase|nr:beta-phosphoglucomutase family hydrolase [Bifidobacteriaceae bacterium]
MAPLRAILFDLDGVLTPTAEVHRRAWSALFTDYLAACGATPPYSDLDYFRYIDGKPRCEGARDLLESRGLRLPRGADGDSPDALTIAGLGNRKNAIFTRLLADDGVAPFPGTVSLLAQLAAAGKAMAVVSSSKNARSVLASAGLSRYFDVVIDGEVAAVEHLRGKPAPDTFTRAARCLGVAAAHSAVVEDAVAGVAAGRAGGFALVVGVDRGIGASALTEAGADVVVDNLPAMVTHGPLHTERRER